MSTATVTTRTRTGRDRSTMFRPGLVTLTRLEMRKMVDTRSGFWLLLIIGLVTVVGVGFPVIAGARGAFAYLDLFQFTVLPSWLLLPILGILMVTTEWSQRTVMSTYTLVPQRGRVAVAKVFAAVSWAVVSIAWGLAVAGLGYGALVLLGRTDPVDWGLPLSSLAACLLFELMYILIGIAFGMAFQNSPLAIVLFFVVPYGFTAVAQSVPALQSNLTWLDLNGYAFELLNSDLSNVQWEHIASGLAFWLLLPGVVGTWRVLTREVK